VSHNVDIVRRVFAAFEHRDAHALRSVSAPDMVFESYTGQFAGVDEPYRGHQGLERYLADVARVWQELRPVPDRFLEGDDGIVVATGRVYAWGEGRVIDAPAGWLWRVHGGLVVYGRVFDTVTGALEAAGMLDRR
jgi:ketosteroid isomerase-like protein